MVVASMCNSVAVTPRAVFSVKRALAYDGPLFIVRPVFSDEKCEVVADAAGELRFGNGALVKQTLMHNAFLVDTWCDQSGNGRHAHQEDKFKQPYLAVSEEGGFTVDFKYGRYLTLPDATLPAGDNPFSVVFKHGEINNLTGGVLGSGVYTSQGASNAIRRSGDGYVNYFWGNDLHTGRGTYAKGNVVSFMLTAGGRHTSAINGVPDASREGVQRYSAPLNTTIGKTYGENEFLNGTLDFLYITEGVSPMRVSLETGEWGVHGF
jgi:hypothetical protein